MEKPKKEGKKTCCGNESHPSRSTLSNRRSQTSHETGSTLLGSRTLGDDLPRLDGVSAECKNLKVAHILLAPWGCRPSRTVSLSEYEVAKCTDREKSG